MALVAQLIGAALAGAFATALAFFARDRWRMQQPPPIPPPPGLPPPPPRGYLDYYVMPICTALLGLTAVAVGAAAVGELSFFKAAIFVLVGNIAFIAVHHAIRLLSEGDTIEVQSDWGGLGGGLGGWRLSSAGGLMLFALVLSATAVTLAVYKDSPVSSGTEGAKKDAAAETKKAPNAKVGQEGAHAGPGEVKTRAGEGKGGDPKGGPGGAKGGGGTGSTAGP